MLQRNSHYPTVLLQIWRPEVVDLFPRLPAPLPGETYSNEVSKASRIFSTTPMLTNVRPTLTDVARLRKFKMTAYKPEVHVYPLPDETATEFQRRFLHFRIFHVDWLFFDDIIGCFPTRKKDGNHWSTFTIILNFKMAVQNRKWVFVFYSILNFQSRVTLGNVEHEAIDIWIVDKVKSGL
jgi:hypothetical protein